MHNEMKKISLSMKFLHLRQRRILKMTITGKKVVIFYMTSQSESQNNGNTSGTTLTLIRMIPDLHHYTVRRRMAVYFS